VWLRRDGTRLSTVDLFGTDLVLLTGSDGGFWAGAADEVAAGLGVPVRTHVVGKELTDANGEFLVRYGISASGATLVRPDGVVAWRTADAPGDPTRALHDVVTAVLAR
jgi:putative polyketide hydroxylase